MSNADQLVQRGTAGRMGAFQRLLVLIQGFYTDVDGGSPNAVGTIRAGFYNVSWYPFEAYPPRGWII